MEKAIAYLFGNKIVGTVKLTDVGDCVFYEIDIKNIQNPELALFVDKKINLLDFTYTPFLCKGRIRVSFYSDLIGMDKIIGKKILLVDGGAVLAEGNMIKVYPGKRFYTEELF
ncbi:MAG: hypothetical protein E7384_05215 [Ruminococcaceae bacterium]|nr:hypothetical protein [Oscillospiraceae bacterium]